MSDTPTHDDVPVLRYHRFGGGYRRDDVEAALAKLLVTVRTMGQDLEALRRKSAELDTELRSKDAALAAYRAREERLEATVSRAEDLLARVRAAAGE